MEEEKRHLKNLTDLIKLCLCGSAKMLEYKMECFVSSIKKLARKVDNIGKFKFVNKVIHKLSKRRSSQEEDPRAVYAETPNIFSLNAYYAAIRSETNKLSEADSECNETDELLKPTNRVNEVIITADSFKKANRTSLTQIKKFESDFSPSKNRTSTPVYCTAEVYESPKEEKSHNSTGYSSVNCSGEGFRSIPCSPKTELAPVDLPEYHPQGTPDFNSTASTGYLSENSPNRGLNSNQSPVVSYPSPVRFSDNFPHKENELISLEVLDSFKNFNRLVANKELLEIETVPKRRHPLNSPSEEKFIVNLFESRPSIRWKRQRFFKTVEEFNLTTKYSMKIMQNRTKEDKNNNIQGSDANDFTDDNAVDQDEIYRKLRIERDAQCLKMTQASNALKAIKQKFNEQGIEVLLPEKILLQSTERFKLVVNKIRDLKYPEDKSETTKHVATVTLSNFRFPLKPTKISTKNKYTEFYMLMISNGNDIMFSEVVRSTEDTINFEDTFTFRNMGSNFNLKLKIFSLRLKNTCKFSNTLLRKKANTMCPMSKICYEDINTNELEESTVLRSSFKVIGEMEIGKEYIQGKCTWDITTLPEDSNLQAKTHFAIKVRDLKIDANLSGFLTVGEKFKDKLNWDRRWCVLKGTQLEIYNYPTEEGITDPVRSEDLTFCISSDIEAVHCPKRRTFVLKTARPGLLHDEDKYTLRQRPNFVSEKIYFSADNGSDFKKWTDEIQSILHALKDWNHLIFADES